MMDQPSPKQVLLDGRWLLPRSVLHFRYDRASGPGGQNVNKLNTRATLTVRLADLADHLPAGVMTRLPRLAGPWLAGDRLVIIDDSSRSQRTNRQACIDRLSRLVAAAAVRPKSRRPTRPTRASVEKRLQHKKRHSRLKRLRSSRPDRP